MREPALGPHQISYSVVCPVGEGEHMGPVPRSSSNSETEYSTEPSRFLSLRRTGSLCSDGLGAGVRRGALPEPPYKPEIALIFEYFRVAVETMIDYRFGYAEIPGCFTGFGARMPCKVLTDPGNIISLAAITFRNTGDMGTSGHGFTASIQRSITATKRVVGGG